MSLNKKILELVHRQTAEGIPTFAMTIARVHDLPLPQAKKRLQELVDAGKIKVDVTNGYWEVKQ